jgi:hypothetical protein
MSHETHIPGGYILLARKMIDSEIMNKPPHFLKLWIWMLSKAFWKDGEYLKRGQLHTTITEMQDVGRYLRGGKMVGRLTEDQVRAAYGYLAKGKAITATKTTRGMIISIVNYDSYQSPCNYEPHNENETRTNPTTDPTQKSTELVENVTKNDHCTTNETRNETGTNPIRKMKKEKEYKTSCVSHSSNRPPSGEHQTFIAWWSYAFERTQGKPYLTSGKDFKPVKELLTTYGLKPLVIMACWFLTCQDAWLASKRDISMLKSQINRIPGPKNEGHNATAYRAAGIIPPEGVMLENWNFWQQNEVQEALAL